MMDAYEYWAGEMDRAADDGSGRLVQPMYLAVECGSTSRRSGRSPSTDHLVCGLIDELAVNPILRDKVRLAVVHFDESPRLVETLCDPLSTEPSTSSGFESFPRVCPVSTDADRPSLLAELVHPTTGKRPAQEPSSARGDRLGQAVDHAIAPLMFS